MIRPIYLHEDQWKGILAYGVAAIGITQIVLSILTLVNVGTMNAHILCGVNLSATLLVSGSIKLIFFDNSEQPGFKTMHFKLILIFASFIIANSLCLAGKIEPKMIAWVTLGTPVVFIPFFAARLGKLLCSD